MPSLICLVQRLSLGDSTRTIVKEGERFEVDEQTAEMYVKGGIAKPAEVLAAPAEKEPEPESKPVQEAPVNEPVQTEETEKVSRKKKPGR